MAEGAAHRTTVTGMSTADVGGAPDAPGRTPGRAAGGPPAARPAPPSRRRALAGWAISLALVLLLAFGIRTFVFQVFSIPTASMVPTLDVYDRILVQKAFFNWHQLGEGDIVVFTHPPRDHCGRPGHRRPRQARHRAARPDHLLGRRHPLRDGRRLREPYLPRHDPLGPPIPGATRQDPFHVPAGEFYVMGDHRAISCDSRFWGPIRGSSIIGKVIMLLWRDGHPDFHFF